MQKVAGRNWGNVIVGQAPGIQADEGIWGAAEPGRRHHTHSRLMWLDCALDRPGLVSAVQGKCCKGSRIWYDYKPQSRSDSATRILDARVETTGSRAMSV
jgi:hypothetical protein